MPFSPQTLSVLARGGDFTLWRYESAEDPADLLAATYFLPAAGILRRGDLVSCVGVGAGAEQRTALLVVEAAPGRVLLEPLQSLPPASLGALADVRVAEAAADDVLTFADGGWTNRPGAGRAGDAFAAAHGGAAGAEAHPVATPAQAGFMAAADKQKLDRIEAGATGDQTGAELVEAIDGEFGGADWRQDASAWGQFHGKTLGPALVDRGGAIDVDVASVVASVPRTRAISGPAGEDPSISLELPAAVDRRDFLLAFTATGAVTTTKVATAADVDDLVVRGISVVPSMAELRSPISFAGTRARAATASAGGAVVFLRGYRAPLDGGEGFFVWDPVSTAADDGGTVITVAGSAGRWKRSLSGDCVNVRCFDSPLSAFAFSQKREQENRSTVLYFPAGTYDLSGITVTNTTALLGEGVSTLITGKPSFTTSSKGWRRFSYCKNVTMVDGITLHNAKGWLFENMCFKSAVSFPAGTLSHYNLFLLCSWDNVAIAVDCEGNHNFNAFTNCRAMLAKDAMGGLKLFAGRDLNPGNQWTISNFAFESSSAVNGPAIYMEGSNHIILGGYFETKYAGASIDISNCKYSSVMNPALIGTRVDIGTASNHNKFSGVSSGALGENGGSIMVSPNEHGEAQFSHRLIRSPSFAVVSMMSDTAHNVQLADFDGSIVRVRVRDLSGALASSGTYKLSWFAKV